MKKRIKYLVCSALILGNIVTSNVSAMTFSDNEMIVSTGNSNEGNQNGDVSGAEATDVSDMTEGASKDLAFTNYSVSGNQAGQVITINFTVTANSSPSNKYNIANIKRVFANVDDSFPFETNDEANRIITTSGNTVNVSYSFTAKDNLDTSYYPVSFTIVYDRNRKYKDSNNIEKTELITDTEYYLTKSYSVKINAKPDTSVTDNVEQEESDVAINVSQTAEGTYGKTCAVKFNVKSNNCKITNVTPVINESFPFETKGEAYKNISSEGTESLDCEYSFSVKEDVQTSYQYVSFAITYLKGGKKFTAEKTLSVHLVGKEENTKEVEAADTDIKIQVDNTPKAVYGNGCKVLFNVKSDKCKIVNVVPVIGDNFPFETKGDAYRNISSNGSENIKCSYNFLTRKDVTTGYQSVEFAVTYLKQGKRFTTNKMIRIQTEGKKDDKKDQKDPETADTDINIEVNSTAQGVYGEKCNVEFIANSKNCKITNVAPIINESFPFETKGDAYKNITSKGDEEVKCSYNFTVRKDVTTGYKGVTFAISYIKDGKTLTANKTMNVYIEGKKEKNGDSSASGETKNSTPRLMVMGCETDVEQIFPNDVFKLTIHLKNNAKKTVSNIKVTLSSEEKNFISTNGASSAYVESIGAGENADVTFELQADSSLTAKAYGISVKTEYEDMKANPYTAEDSLTIPVSLKADLKVSDIQIPYDFYVGSEGTLSFTITNTGAATLYNVNVKCEGEDFSCEETFVGNIVSGNSGYASIPLTGTKMTEGEGVSTISITYEDNKGNQNTVTEPTNIYVYDMGDMVEEPIDEEIEEVESKKNIWPYVVGIIVVVAIVIFIIIRKRNKRKQVEELMEDDI